MAIRYTEAHIELDSGEEITLDVIYEVHSGCKASFICPEEFEDIELVSVTKDGYAYETTGDEDLIIMEQCFMDACNYIDDPYD
jgi:hypothetical protein